MDKCAVAFLLLGVYVTLSSSVNVVCYFTSWTVYRPKNGTFTSSDVDTRLCTHILYAFVGLDDNRSGNISILDPWEAVDDYGYKAFNKLVALKEKNPELKVLLSLGGWNEANTDKYSVVVGDPAKRATLVQSALDMMEKYGFDGFDVDWEYPNQRPYEPDSRPEDVTNFVSLLKELKEALHRKGLILSAAVSGGVHSTDLSYNVQEVSDHLDMINIMTYDYHGGFEDFVGHYAPLYPSHLDKTEEQRSNNVDAGLQHWLDLGADPSKINLGLGTYGRTFTLVNTSNAELYAPVIPWNGGGNAGPYTGQNGVIGYNEVCEFFSDWPVTWDDEQKVPHKVLSDQWIGYDDAESLKLKAEYAKSRNLGGVMIWSLDTDDFLNICGNGRYPLLTAVNQVLGRI